MNMDKGIKLSSFLKKYFGLLFTYSILLTISGIGFILFYIVYGVLSMFEIKDAINNIISFSIVFFLIGVYVAYEVAKDAMVNSEVIKKQLEKAKEEADIYCEQKKNQADNFFKEAQNELSKVIEDEKIYKPFLAQIYSDYLYYLDLKTSDYLRYKKNPAQKAADEVRIIAKEKRGLNEKLKIMEHQLSVYENAFPWLEEFKEVRLMN